MSALAKSMKPHLLKPRPGCLSQACICLTSHACVLDSSVLTAVTMRVVPQAWFYRAGPEAAGRVESEISCRDYLGSVEQLALNDAFAAVLFEGGAHTWQFHATCIS